MFTLFCLIKKEKTSVTTVQSLPKNSPNQWLMLGVVGLLSLNSKENWKLLITHEQQQKNRLSNFFFFFTSIVCQARIYLKKIH